MSRSRLVAVAALAVFAFFATRPIRAQEAGIDIADLNIGFAGQYKIGHWSPVRITMRSTAEQSITGVLALRAVDGDGSPTTVRLDDVSVTAKGEATAPALFKIGRSDEPVEVQFDSRAGVASRVFPLAQKPSAGELLAPLLATQELIVQIGGSIGLERLERLYSENILERPAVARVPSIEELPGDWLGYDGVDLVVITTSDPALNDSWRKSEERLAALDQWLRLGGKLIFCVGREAAEVLAEDSPLARYAPGRFERVVERRPAAWESFAAALAEPMQSPNGGPAPAIATAKLTDVRGRVELSDGPELPAVVRFAYGFGEVLFVAVDLDQPPFDAWSARTKLVLKLLNRVEPAAGQRAGAAGAASVRLGYADLSGQLRASLSDFGYAQMVPFWLFFCVTVGYAAAVFPLEHYLSRWLRPRFEAAWFLLPLVLFAGGMGAWWIVRAWKGSLPLVNKIDTVDVDLAGGLVRGHTWLGLYSPDVDAYDVQVDPSLPAENVAGSTRLSWLGLPGEGLGGMNSQTAVTQPFDVPYRYDGNRLEDVPLTAWSIKTFEASWHATIASGEAELSERSADRQPLGIVENKTGTALDQCVLFYEGWSYALGALAPGDRVDVSRIQRLQTVESYLIGRRTVGDREQATPYDPQASDAESVLRAILFHEAAGGRQYTSLVNRAYHRLDATPGLRLGRAVVLARGKPATSVQVTGRRGQTPQLEDDLTFYRFLIPVNRSRRDEGGAAVALRLE